MTAKTILVSIYLALGQTSRLARILGNHASLDSAPVAPSIILAELRLPRPKDPAHLLLVRLHLRGPPLLVEILVLLRLPLGRVLDLVLGGQGPLADDDGLVVVGAEGVLARRGDVVCLCVLDGRPLEVAVIVEGHARLALQHVARVAGPPRLVHELDRELLVGGGDADALLDVADLVVRVLVEGCDEVAMVAFRLVEHLQHARRTVRVVLVDAFRHDLEEFDGPAVVVLVEEARGRRVLAREGLVGLLGSGGAVEVQDHVHASLRGALGEAVHLGQAARGERLAVLFDRLLDHPVADGDADRVDAPLLHLVHVLLGDPRVPVLLERGVALLLAQLAHAVEFRVGAAAAHVVPLAAGHPRLDDEERSEVHAADLVEARVEAFDGAALSRRHVADD